MFGGKKMTSTELKVLVDYLCETVEKVVEKFGAGSNLRNVARLEVAMFMMYLSASDGTIKWEEAKTLSEICGLNLTPNNIADLIRKQNIYSTEFEDRVPVSFQMMVAADNALKKQGLTSDVSAADLMIKVYKEIGEALIKSDSDVDDNELRDYNIYINMLQEYRDKNGGDVSGTTGFTKNSGSSVSAPNKSGIAAPRKG
jgi:hypothetical protein